MACSKLFRKIRLLNTLRQAELFPQRLPDTSGQRLPDTSGHTKNAFVQIINPPQPQIETETAPEVNPQPVSAPQKKVQPQVVQTIQTLESILKSKELELTNKESSLEGEKNRLANLFNSLEEAKDLKFGFDKKIKEISDNLF
jgi:hypothetical protein